MKLTPVYLDFESFWSATHTLSKMTNIAYVMHPDTEIISLSIRVKDYPTDVFFGEDKIQKALNSLRWDDKIAIGHNMSGFDALIMAWRFNIRPRMWGCTAAMARSKYAKTCGVSLKALAEELGIGVKDATALLNTKGKYLKDFKQEELDAMRDYNREDTELCARLFKRLAKGFPRKEMWQIHATTQMLVDPKFELDVDLIRQAQTEEFETKARALKALQDLLLTTAEQVAHRLEGVDTEEWTRTQLASSPKFAELLATRGVECPMKPSPTNPQKMTYALAKTDQEFLALEDHEDPVVAAAVRARLSVKSTLLETRLEAFRAAAADCTGLLPIPTKYAGADTTGRRSGEIYNPLNLPRIPRDRDGAIVHKTSNALRLSMRAPKGHLVVVADQSNIELRVNHVLWKVASTMALFAKDPQGDLYKEFAAARYHVPVKDVAKEQRQMGKVAHLGLGFGAGAPKFKIFAKAQFGLDIEADEADEVVRSWRHEYADIVNGWKTCNSALRDCMAGVQRSVDPWGLVSTFKEGLRLPSGRAIYYPEMAIADDGAWEDGRRKRTIFYGKGRHRARITGPKTDENIVQALARDVNADVMYDVWRMTSFMPAMECYDELVYVVPEKEAQPLLDCVQQRMRTPPTWWPALVTWSEGDIADCYGEAK